MKRLAFCSVAFAVTLVVEGAVPPAKLPHVVIADPADDSFPDPRATVVPDLVSVTLQVETDGGLNVGLQLAPGTLSKETAFLQVSFDLDDDTAPLGPDRGCGEFLLNIGALGGPPGTVSVSHLNRTTGKYEVTSTLTARWGPHAVSVVVPSRQLGKSFRRVVFRVSAAIRLEAGATTPIVDYLPDTGVATLVVP